MHNAFLNVRPAREIEKKRFNCYIQCSLCIPKISSVVNYTEKIPRDFTIILGPREEEITVPRKKIPGDYDTFRI